MDKVLDSREPMSKEKRRYIRVYDAVGLYIQRLLEVPAAGQPVTPLPTNRVRKFDKYEIEGYASVRAEYPAVAQYIADLEERIRQLLLNADEVPTKPTHKVNMSAGGLYFSDSELFYPDELLSLGITLFPTGQRVFADARVVSANDADYYSSVTDKPSYRVEFVRIGDTDRRVLETHVDQLLTKRQHLQE